MRRFLSGVLALGLVLSFSLVTAVPAAAAPAEVWVDDDFTSSTPGWGVTRFDSIQDAILAVFADPGSGIVHVLDGTYYENISLRNGVNVLGAGAGVTTIDAPGGRAVSAASIGAGTTFSGFTVTGGNTDYGGGMYISNSTSSLTVRDCVFTGNHADDRGGGIYNNVSTARIINCVLSNNTAGMGGGGIACRNSSNPTIANCVIINNIVASTYGGGGIEASFASHPTIVNNTIVNNEAPDGGGIKFIDLPTAITNNIIYNNTATAAGGGIYCNTPTPAIDFNDVYGNNATTDNNYSGCTAGTGAISALPDFTDAEYHIDSDSPCIDVGDNTAVPGWLTTDFDGEPRIFDGGVHGTIVDMGADEFLDNEPPDDPFNLGPAAYTGGDPVNDDTPTLEFSQSDPDGTDTVKYTIQIGNDPVFSPPVVNYTSGLMAQGGADFTVGQDAGGGVYTIGSPGQTLPEGEYFWKVMTTDQWGLTSGWTKANFGGTAFWVDTSLPTPPPSHGAVGGTVYPIDKAALLLPWLGLGLVMILAAGGLILVRRRTR